MRGILRVLADKGHPSVLVGGCVRDWIEGRPVRDFDVATPAAPEEVLALFPRAVPIGLRHGTVMVPTAAGPVDVTTYRCGPHLHDDLAHRDFTVNAMALDPVAGEIVDPFGGAADLRAGRLRAVGPPSDRLREDPLRALRAVRLVSERGFEPDGPLRAALGQAAQGLPKVAGERIRAELERILLGAHVERALGLLRETGLEAALAPGVRPEAAERVAALPRRRDERLAGWLLGTRVRPVLARLRLSRPAADRIDRLLRAHPIHRDVHPDRPASVRRLLQRWQPDELAFLLSLAELAAADGAPPPPEAAAQIAALRAAIARIGSEERVVLSRSDLALDGAAVMEILGAPPGPVVGDALRYLMENVLDDPASNTPERLRSLLQSWAEGRR